MPEQARSSVDCAHDVLTIHPLSSRCLGRVAKNNMLHSRLVYAWTRTGVKMTGLSSDQLAWNVVVGWVGLGVEAWTGLVQGALVSWCRSLPIITLCPSHPLQPPTLHQPQHCLTTCMTFGERMLHMLMDIYKKTGGFVQTHHQHLQIASGSLVEVSTKLPPQVEVYWKFGGSFHQSATRSGSLMETSSKLPLG